MATRHCKEILIVEDDEQIGETLELALALEGYDVSTAANGQEGLDRLKRPPLPRLILLDLMMPIMDGWAFAEKLRDDKVLARIPVVVVTAFPDRAESVTQAREVLKKPFELDALVATVKKFCDE